MSTRLAPVLVALALSCGQTSPTQKAPLGGSGSASATAPALPARAGAGGSGIAVLGKALFALDRPGEALLVTALPLVGTPARHALPGRPRELVASAGRLLVTIQQPSALLVLGEDLQEQARVTLPAGAGGLVLSADGATALVVSEAAAEVSAVDVGAGTVMWSVTVPRAPRRVLLGTDGTRAFVTHLVGPGPTMLDAKNGWAVPPTVTPASGGRVRVDGIAATLGHGTVLVHGRWQDRTVVPEVEIVASDGKRGPWGALPAGSFARAVRAKTDTVLVATDDALIEVGADRARGHTPFGERGCRDPGGIALADDGKTAYLVCGDGHLVSVAPGGVVEHAETSPAPDGCAPEPPLAVISRAFADDFVRSDQVEHILRRYRCRYPDRTDLVEVATSHGGRKVLALAIGRRPLVDHDRPTMFINGGHHGDELLSTIFALDAVAALLEGNAGAGPLADMVFVVAPLVNPDGNFHRLKEGLLGRKNGRDNDGNGTRDHRDGVDLNRNYPFRWGVLGETGSSTDPLDRWYRGPSPGSEPETQGVMRLADREKFVASMSFHTGTLAMCAPYTIPGVQNPEPDVGWSVSEEVVAQLPVHPEGYIPVKRRLYPLDGCDQDWLRHTHGTVALLWEGGKKWLAGEPVKSRLLAVSRASWLRLAERVAKGPTVSGRVLDAAGRPLVAEVSVAEVIHHEGERWMTRCRDGRFDRVLPAAGDYTLVVTVPGLAPIEHKVKVAGASTVDIVVPVVVEREAECPTPATPAGQAAALIEIR